ncbi:MAG: hypothetical protein IH945_05240 [Armatimonadetes bacterium]|nr:hypothetical protein [Armatimonadota bacterium]
MSPAVRVFYGALLGALLVLLIHPASRPYLTPGIWFLGDSGFLRQTDSLPDNLSQLPEPDSLEDSAYWLVIGCERELRGQRMLQDDYVLLVEFAQAGAAQDPDNAFWRHAEAVFQQRLGNDDAALRAWYTASLANRWDDYQTRRLQGLLRGLEAESGRRLAWHYALAQSRKSPTPPRVFLAFARQLLRDPEAHANFPLRLATLRNGRLIRDGSRSVNGGRYGVEIVELAALAPVSDVQGFEDAGLFPSPRILLTARDQFAEIADATAPETSAEIRDSFESNDAWSAFVSRAEARQLTRRTAIGSILAATLSGSLITVGLLGGVVFLAGALISRFRVLQLAFTAPWAQIIGVAGGVAVYLLSGLVFAALWATVSLASFGLRQDGTRQAVPSGLGGAYSLTISLLAVGFSLMMAVFLIGVSAPGEYLLEFVGLLTSFGPGSSTLLSLAAVIASLALVTATVWGYIHKFPADKLAGFSLKHFGLRVCLGCFALGVVIVPASISLDHKFAETLSKVFENEPTYYLTR